MKTMHIHVGVDDVAKSVQFYSALFGAEPVKSEADYAKWLLDDPRLNFAISSRVQKKGVDHLGFQVDSPEALAQMRAQIQQADLSVFDEGETVCCYARSDKSWLQDPAGIAWETYLNMEDVQVFSEKTSDDKAACCAVDQSLTMDKKAGCC